MFYQTQGGEERKKTRGDGGATEMVAHHLSCVRGTREEPIKVSLCQGDRLIRGGGRVFGQSGNPEEGLAVANIRGKSK